MQIKPVMERLASALAKPSPKVVEQKKWLHFAAYGMNKPERGGDIHDAGINDQEKRISKV